MSRHWKETTGGTALVPRITYFIEVCGFTFHFREISELHEALEFYRQKIHPSSRWPRDSRQMRDEAQRSPKWYRQRIVAFRNGHRDEMQRWWERVPLYLQENGKRERVIDALEKALQEFAGDTGQRARA